MNVFSVFLGCFIALVLFAYLCTPKKFPNSRDETDSTDKRSGLILYTEYGTGVQYVYTPLGGLTPRVDKYGKPIIVDTNK